MIDIENTISGGKQARTGQKSRHGSELPSHAHGRLICQNDKHGKFVISSEGRRPDRGIPLAKEISMGCSNRDFDGMLKIKGFLALLDRLRVKASVGRSE